MKEGKSVYYIEIHYNYTRYNIYNVMVKNYEEFWEWLISGDSNEFTVTSFTQREIKYARDKITNFYEKQTGVETARSREIEKIKKDLILPSYQNSRTYETQRVVRVSSEIPETVQTYKEYDEILPENNLGTEHIKKYASRLEKDNMMLKSKISELESKISLKEIHDEVNNEIYQELQQKVELEKSRNDKQSTELELYRQKILNLENMIAEKNLEAEALRKINLQAEQELTVEKSKCTNCKFKGFESDLENIFGKMDYFSEEATRHSEIINELHQRLTAEQHRANKSKKDLEKFAMAVAGLKEKL